MQNKKYILATISLWFLSLMWLLFCFYLSWQTGEETVGFSQQVAQLLLELPNKLGIRPDAQQFHAGLRLFAHFGMFFVNGLLTSSALYISLPRSKWKRAFWIAAISCTVIAVLAEVGKLVVPGRHLTWSETGLNVLGAVVGVAVVCLAVHLYASRKAKRGRSQK